MIGELEVIQDTLAAHEYRVLAKNGIVAVSEPFVILDRAIAEAGVVWLDARWPSLAPHRIETREYQDRSWLPVDDAEVTR